MNPSNWEVQIISGAAILPMPRGVDTHGTSGTADSFQTRANHLLEIAKAKIGRINEKECPPPTVLESARKRLESLIEDSEENESPTDAAQRAFEEQFTNLWQWHALAHNAPMPFVTSVGNGDIVCDWQGPTKKLRLSISSKGNSTLHRLTLDKGRITSHELIENPDSGRLADLIRWFAP